MFACLGPRKEGDMLCYSVSLNHIHESCIAFQDNLYKSSRGRFWAMTSHILSPSHWGQMNWVERQDTSMFLLWACTETFQANLKTNHLSLLCNQLAVSKLSGQEWSGTSHHRKVQASMTRVNRTLPQHRYPLVGLVTDRENDHNQWAYFWPRPVLYQNKTKQKEKYICCFWPKKQLYGHICTCTRVLTSPRYLMQFCSLKRPESDCFRVPYKSELSDSSPNKWMSWNSRDISHSERI